MANSGVLKLACVVLMCMMVGAPHAEGAIACGQVVRSLTPCIPYVTSGGAVPADCCGGVKSLYGAAQITVDRQSVCRCMKSAVAGIGNLETRDQLVNSVGGWFRDDKFALIPNLQNVKGAGYICRQR